MKVSIFFLFQSKLLSNLDILNLSAIFNLSEYFLSTFAIKFNKSASLILCNNKLTFSLVLLIF